MQLKKNDLSITKEGNIYMIRNTIFIKDGNTYECNKF